MEILRNTGQAANRPFFDDVKMFEFIFKAYFPRLLAYARKFIEDREIAEDIIQEVFLKVWEKRKEIEEETFHSYLFTLVRNACLNHIKHQKIAVKYRVNLEEMTKEEGLYYADFFSDPLHQTIFNEVQSEIERIISDLPDQTRRIFRLSRFDGFKNKEIANLLEISLRTVEKHNTIALRKIKAGLSSHYLFAVVVLDILKELKK